MERKEIGEGIGKIISTIVKHQNFELNDDLTAKDVAGWDSLSHMLIITEIENKFNVKFKLKELNKLKNFGSLVELVSSKI